MRQQQALVIALPLVVAACVLICPHVRCATMYVSQQVTADGITQENLVEALKDPNITSIVLLTDISSESLAALNASILLTRWE